MRLATYQAAGQARTGALSGRWLVDFDQARQYLAPSAGLPALPADMIGLLQPESGWLAELERVVAAIVAQLPANAAELAAAGVVLDQDEIQLLPPVRTPGKILCVGLNYPVPGQPPARPDYPVIFGKFANTLAGPRQPVLFPRVSRQVACEGELALVIGRRGRHIPPARALGHLAGYTLANDLTASDLESRSSQWTTGKLPDTFTPLGPVLVTPDELPDLDRLALKTYLNGELALSGQTGAMYFGPRELISYLSEITTLEVGDLILTGSPKGLDRRPAPKVWVRPGDEMAVEVEGIGRLVNQVIAEENDGG